MDGWVRWIGGWTGGCVATLEERSWLVTLTVVCYSAEWRGGKEAAGVKRKWQHQMTNPLLPFQCMCFWVMTETRVQCCWQPRNDLSNRIPQWWHTLPGIHEPGKAEAILRYFYILMHIIVCHVNTGSAADTIRVLGALDQLLELLMQRHLI